MTYALLVARLVENDPEGVNGDLSHVGAVLGKPMPMLKFAQFIA